MSPPGESSDRSSALIVAVPDDVVDELVELGLVEEIPTLRGPVLDAVIVVGVDSAALVTLLQLPDTLRSFAAWVSGHARGKRDGITVQGRFGDREVSLSVSGDVPVEVVTRFLTDVARSDTS